MRYFKGLFLASEPRVEFFSSRAPWIPCFLEDTLVFLEVLLSRPPHTPRRRVEGVGNGTEQGQGWRRGSSTSRPWLVTHCQVNLGVENQSQYLLIPRELLGTALQRHGERKTESGPRSVGGGG